MYEIIDIQTKARVGGLIKSRSTASRKADRLDLEYGAIRYIVRPVAAQ